MNKVILIGNIGKDPETKHLDSGKQVTSISLSTKNVYKDKEGNTKIEADWHFLEFWGKSSEIVEKYCKKGDKIAIEGRSKTKSWTKEGTDEKVYKQYFLCDRIELLGSKKSESKDSGAEQHDVGSDDDLPF